MIPLFVLVVIAAVQIAFIIATLIFIFVTRAKGRRAVADNERAAAVVAGPLRSIMLWEDNGEQLAAALSTLKPHVAAGQLIAVGGSRLSSDQLRAVAVHVRSSGWAERILSQFDSRHWWNRMEAARLLAMIGDERDTGMLACLVTDPNPAVASAATAAIAGRADLAVVRAVATALPSQPSTVRQQQAVALKRHSEIATAVVVELLAQEGCSPRELRGWIQLAETLGTPAALLAVVRYASHENAEVRTSVARALRSCFFPEAVEAAIQLLADNDWRVRAAGARAAGGLNAANAIPMLSAALRDESWWVRFRAALALAELHEDGLTALGDARQSDDPYARDMANLVCSLSVGTRLELTSA